MLKKTLKYAIVPFLFFPALHGSAAESGPDEAWPRLMFPVSCTLGQDCWIARYADHTKGPGTSDYRCGTATQDGHAGTDIMVADLGRMKAGVAVLAVADGTVIRLRDGEPDESVRDRGLEAIKGKGCGNALVIAHANGLQSEYCHLKKGSLKVKVGDHVSVGQEVAEIGLSGETEYPHLHYMARAGGKVIDPFDGNSLGEACGTGRGALWAHEIPYEPAVLLPLQFSDHARTVKDRWDAPPAALSVKSPALVLMARGLHVRKGDRWHMAIYDPKGRLFREKDMVIQADKQIYSAFIGRRNPGGALLPGLWTGIMTIEGPSTAAGAHLPLKLKTRILVKAD